MLEIEYKGGNSVILATKKSTVVVDPHISMLGLKDVTGSADVELATEERFRMQDSKAQTVIHWPGEYEVGDFSIRGVAAMRHIDADGEQQATIYRIEAGDFRVGVLGNIAPQLSDDQLEGIGVVDILVIPVGGGGYTLDATSAATLVRQIEPKVVIPVHYKDTGVNYEVPQDSIDTFITELGAPSEEAAAKLKFKTTSALPAILTVMPLTRS